jgi:hypothetical protein
MGRKRERKQGEKKRERDRKEAVREINRDREWKRYGERVSEWERGRGTEGRESDRWLFGHAGWTVWECWVREIEGKREKERERMMRERLLSKRESEWGGERNRGEIRGRKRERGWEGETGRRRDTGVKREIKRRGGGEREEGMKERARGDREGEREREEESDNR